LPCVRIGGCHLPFWMQSLSPHIVIEQRDFAHRLQIKTKQNPQRGFLNFVVGQVTGSSGSHTVQSKDLKATFSVFDIKMISFKIEFIYKVFFIRNSD